MATKKNQTVDEFLFEQITARGLGEDEPAVIAIWLGDEEGEYEDLVEVSVKPKQQRSRSMLYEWAPVDDSDEEE